MKAQKLGKSARTRAGLMDAATALFASEGFEAASVNRIAHAAGVVNGTFYRHFKDKDEIAAAVAFEICAEIVQRLDRAMADIDDAVERAATATRRFVELAEARPEWGMALFHALWFFPDLRKSVTAYARADLARGAKQGAFTAVVDDMTVDLFTSMTMIAVFGRLKGGQPPGIASRTAEMQLRMLGVAPKRAHKAAWRALPPLEP